jgi:hypothetical protein
LVHPDTFIPSTADDNSFGPDSQAPYTESFVNANLPGGIFEKTTYPGFLVCMSGTCVFPCCRKSEFATENTTAAEMTAANHLGKVLCWLHLFMYKSDSPSMVLFLLLKTMPLGTLLLTLANSLTMFVILLSKLSPYKLWFTNALPYFKQLVQPTIMPITSPKPYHSQLIALIAVNLWDSAF